MEEDVEWIQVIQGGTDALTYDGRLVRTDQVTQVRRIKETGDIQVRMEGEWLTAHDASAESVADFGALFAALDLSDQV